MGYDRPMSGFALLVAVLVGCGDDDTPSMPDASLVLDASDADAMPPAELELDPPAPPAEAELPDQRPCRPGWTEATTDGGAHVCQPFGGQLQTCEGSTAQYPSSAGCEPIGPSCPTGAFPDDAPSGAIFVRAGATGGDGSRSSPFGTIAEAIAAAPAGGTVMIGKGEYAESVTIGKALTLRGACVAETRLVGGSERTTIDVAVPEDAAPIEVAIMALYVASTDRAAISATSPVALDVADLHIDGGSGWGITAGELKGRHILARGRFPDAAITCGPCELEDVALEGIVNFGVLLTEPDVGSESTIRNITVLAEPSGRRIAVSMSGHSVARIEGMAVREAEGLFATGDAVATLDGVSLEEAGTLAGFDSRASGSVARAWARGSGGARLAMTTSGSVALTQSVFERARLFLQSSSEAAVVLNDGELTLDHVLIDESADIGLLAFAGPLVGTDVVIRNIRSSTEGDTGFGAFASDGQISLTRARFEGCEGAAAFAYGLGSVVTLRDVVVRDGGNEDGLGVGVGAFYGGRVEIERALIERAPMAGLIGVGLRTVITGSDITIRDTRPYSVDHQFGRAISADDRVQVDIERALLERSHEHAVAATSGASVHLRETRIVDIAERDCGEAECAPSPFGVAVGSYASDVTLDGFELRRAALCAVHFVEGSSVALRRGLIADSAIGVCADRDDVDLSALEDDVRYFQNGTNLDARRLPVPSPVPPVSVPEL